MILIIHNTNPYVVGAYDMEIFFKPIFPGMNINAP